MSKVTRLRAPTPGQFRAARAWLNLPRRTVAEMLDMSDYSLQTIEGCGTKVGTYQPSRGLIGKLHNFYVEKGFVFIGEGGIAKHESPRGSA